MPNNVFVYLNVFDFLTVNELLTPGGLHKPEFKSPAEERLIRKMAKMALNGYEIGIQRKIKPGDHIQTMADKIQDTVVTKHPLNADNVSSEENSRDNTLKRPIINTNIDKVYKAPDPSIISIGDKIKETLMINHPANTLNGNKQFSPPPPPLPSSPIPSLNTLSTPKKQSDFIIKNNTPNLNGFEKSHYSENEYSSSDDSNKDKPENNNSDTLQKKKFVEKASFLNGMNKTNDTKPETNFETSFSNTLNKRKMFERDTLKSPVSPLDNNRSKVGVKFNNKSNNDTWNKNNAVEKTKQDIIDTVLNQSTKKGLSNDLQDNTLYSYKSISPESNGLANISKSDLIDNKDIKYPVNDFEDNDEEVVVTRRQKKCTRNDDGRRDSHIIARPLSTMTSTDAVDGLYPVCHKCDKAIKR